MNNTTLYTDVCASSIMKAVYTCTVPMYRPVGPYGAADNFAGCWPTPQYLLGSTITTVATASDEPTSAAYRYEHIQW